MLDYTPYHPTFAWIVPPPGKDTIVVEGQAYVDFRVNRTELDEHYRNNTAELKKILATIDVVKNDPDCSIVNVHIKGHASPEGSYANNVRLAEGRTATLKQYVQQQEHFAEFVVMEVYAGSPAASQVEQSEIFRQIAAFPVFGHDVPP
jgi:outer membrane protein OmpA-like peptidoglycan-associated protein